MRLYLLWLLTVLLCTCDSAQTKTVDTPEAPEGNRLNPMEFTSHRVVDDARWWWALTVGDVTNDGLQDVVYIDNNANGGYLGYREGTRDTGVWKTIVIAKTPPTGGTFAAGDLETGDMDGDGDQDVLAVKHTGEWDEAGAPAEIFYYENPTWKAHAVGMAKDAVKDLSIGDFDGDGLADLAVLTYDESNLRIHRQRADGSFTLVQDISQEGLHEGMDVGDLDGDGNLDITANGFVFTNPGGNLKSDWIVSVIDDKWHNQTGDWSANGTKSFVADIDGDGSPEVFISHSERGGYPLAYYSRNGDGTFTEHVVVEDLPAAHTLQVFDMDMDGDADIVTGVNYARAVNLEPKVSNFPVLVLTNDGRGNFERKTVGTEGIYNGRVADFEGDGDYDIFRYPNHEATDLFLLENETISK